MSKTPTEQQKVEALFSLAYDCQQKGQFPKAIGAYQEAIRRSPENPSLFNNLGNCYRSLGLYQESLIQYEAALAIEPGKHSTLLNKSLALLALNRYQEAWPLYRERLRTINYRKEVLTSGKPEWDGSELSENQRLFLYSNQGLGDELQALRYLPRVVERAKHIILEVQKPNFRLLKDIPGIREVRVRPSGDTSLPDFEYHCEIFTLPEIFKTDFDTIPLPWRPPFERAPGIRQLIAQERAQFPAHKHIGLVWSGNPRNDVNKYRACGLIHQLPLLKLENCRFYSLQKGLPRNDIRQFQAQTANLLDLADHLPDMAATATAIEELDLLITTDTSIPHLAGTLGVSSWVLLHDTSDWRWTTDHAATPWYPQLRLFRQTQRGVWTSLLDEVSRELAQLK